VVSQTIWQDFRFFWSTWSIVGISPHQIVVQSDKHTHLVFLLCILYFYRIALFLAWTSKPKNWRNTGKHLYGITQTTYSMILCIEKQLRFSIWRHRHVTVCLCRYFGGQAVAWLQASTLVYSPAQCSEQHGSYTCSRYIEYWASFVSKQSKTSSLGLETKELSDFIITMDLLPDPYTMPP